MNFKDILSDDDNGTLKGFHDLLKQKEDASSPEKPHINDTEPDVNSSTPTWNLNMGVKAPNMADGGDISQQPSFSDVLAKMLPVAASYVPGMGANIEAGAMTNPAVRQLAGQVLPANLQPTPSTPPTPPVNPEAGLPPVDPNAAMPQAPQGPSLNQASQTAQQGSPTDYNFYKNMSAEDRNALYQKLTQQQHTGGAIAAGVGGIGDAITNSFGRGNQHTQQQIMQNTEASKQGQLGAMDTQREQKMQDLQARMTMASSDPASPVSNAYRQMGKIITGKTFPSGVSAAQIDKFMPLIGKQLETSTQSYIAQGEQGVKAATEQFGESPFKQFVEWAVSAKQPGEGGLKAAQNKAFPGTANSDTQDVTLPKSGQTVNHPSGATITRMR